MVKKYTGDDTDDTEKDYVHIKKAIVIKKAGKLR
jgi:hypothetical protein